MMPLVKKLIRNVWFSYYKDVFARRSGKRVLVSYLTAHRYRSVGCSHTVYLEVDQICTAFHNCGFVVDLVDYRYDWRIDYSRYEAVCGWGLPFSRALDCGANVRSIYFLNNAMNLSDEVGRIRYLKERRGRAVQPRRRYFDPDIYECLALSECVVSLGTEWTTSTIRPYNSNVYRVPAPIYSDDIPYVDPRGKSLDVRRHFLWFGSTGAVHKGLDILLDIFAEKPELHLHVCGNIAKEEDFIRMYSDLLYRRPNVTFHGFVPVTSARFQEILRQCAFVVHPSCSEGGCGSVLTCMAAGLIPVVTCGASIEVGDFGYMIEDVTVKSFGRTLSAIAEDIASDDLVTRSERASTYARSKHSPASFVAAFEDVIRTRLLQ